MLAITVSQPLNVLNAKYEINIMSLLYLLPDNFTIINSNLPEIRPKYPNQVNPGLNGLNPSDVAMKRGNYNKERIVSFMPIQMPVHGNTSMEQCCGLERSNTHGVIEIKKRLFV